MKCKKLGEVLKICAVYVTLRIVVVTDGRMEIFEITTNTTFLLSFHNLN